MSDGGESGFVACLAINSSWEHVCVNLPPAALPWRALLDSGADAPDDVTLGGDERVLRAGSTYTMAGKAVLLLVADAELAPASHGSPASMGTGEASGRAAVGR